MSTDFLLSLSEAGSPPSVQAGSPLAEVLYASDYSSRRIDSAKAPAFPSSSVLIRYPFLPAAMALGPVLPFFETEHVDRHTTRSTEKRKAAPIS